MITYLPSTVSIPEAVSTCIRQASATHFPFPEENILSGSHKKSSVVGLIEDPGTAKYIVKLYFKNFVKGLFSKKDHGLREYNNYRRAKENNIPVILPMAYFQKRFALSTQSSGLIFEDNKNHLTLEQCIKTGSDTPQGLMEKVATVLGTLARKRLNYIDFTPMNIIWDSSTTQIHLIDFKHLYDLEAKPLDFIFCQASHFINYLPDRHLKSYRKLFIEQLHAIVEHSYSKKDFEQRLMRKIDQAYLSRGNRIALNATQTR
jgi:tRNA A-37 threonylcarbamoyl transferase component Bud32